MTEPFVFLEPTGTPGIAPRPHTARLEKGAAKLRLTLLNNGYVDAKPFLADFGNALSTLLNLSVVNEFTKSNIAASGALMTDEQLDAVVARSDIVAGVGHCGGCTVSITRAAVSLSERGKPVVVMVTERFARLAAFTALSVGVPDVPIIIVPHPIAGKSEVYHRAAAQALAPHLLQGLREGASLETPPPIDQSMIAT